MTGGSIESQEAIEAVVSEAMLKIERIVREEAGRVADLARTGDCLFPYGELEPALQTRVRNIFNNHFGRTPSMREVGALGQSALLRIPNSGRRTLNAVETVMQCHRVQF